MGQETRGEIVGVVDGVVVRRADVERFESFVYPEPNSGCFIWSGSGTKAGYGLFQVRKVKGARERVYSHRMAWFIAHGSLPGKDLLLRHKCHQPYCCNPDHLVEGSSADNSLDMAKAGRGSKSKIGMPYGVSVRIRKGKKPVFAVKIRGGGKSYRSEFRSLEKATEAARKAREEIYGRVFIYA